MTREDTAPAAGTAWFAAGVGLMGALLGGAAVYLGLRGPGAATGEAMASAAALASDTTAETSEASLEADEPATVPLADAFARVRASVVNLHTSGSLGSGVIVDERGIVVTNFHVIAEALQPGFGARPQIAARFADGRQLPVRVLVADRAHDLALLQLEGKNETFAAARLGRSSKLRVGQDVFAVGNPFGLAHTVSRGIVSAVDRTGVLESTKAPMIQLDASINVGNTGGPLFDLQGELVGIVAARSRQAEGIAFAVPSDHVGAFLRAVDTRRSGVVGVALDLQRDVSSARALGYEAGLAVDDVREPALGAGLREGDIIVALRGTRLDAEIDAADPVRLAERFVEAVRTLFPGERLAITVVRDGTLHDLVLEVGEASERDQVFIDADELLGLRLVREGDAPVIESVRPDSPLAPNERRLRGATIVRMVGAEVRDLDGLGTSLASLRKTRDQRASGMTVVLVLRGPDGEDLGEWPVAVP